MLDSVSQFFASIRNSLDSVEKTIKSRGFRSSLNLEFELKVSAQIYNDSSKLNNCKKLIVKKLGLEIVKKNGIEFANL